MSSWYGGGYILLDPSDLERMFSEDNSWANLPTVNDEVPESSLIKLDRVREYLDQLPPREADFIELYFFNHVRQTAIAELFNVSQPTVCYRLQRGAARLRYLIEMPEFEFEQMEEELAQVLDDPTDVRIMTEMVRTTCQSDVARGLSVTQGFVRHRFLRTIDRLKGREGMDMYVKIFQLVAENLNILKNSCRSSWAEEIIHSVC